MSQSKWIVIFMTLSMCIQRISIAVGNILFVISIVLFLHLLYAKKKANKPLFNSDCIEYFKVYGIFLLFLLPSVFFAGTFKISFNNFMEMWIYRFLPFIIITNICFEENLWKKCLWYLLAYEALDGVIAFGQMIATNGQRNMGLGDGILRFSCILVTLFPIALVLWLDKVNFEKKKCIPFIALLLFLGTIGTQSRGAWLTNACILFFAGCKYISKSFKRVMTIVGVLVCLAGLFVTVPQLQTRLYSIDNITTDRSNGDRVEAWKSAFVMFKEKPFVGWGLNQSNKDYLLYYRSPLETQGLSHFHNNYIEMAVNTGFIGSLGYILLILAILWMHRDWSNCYNTAIALSWIAFHVFGAIEYNVDLSASVKILWFALGILVCLKNNSAKISDKKPVG